MSSSSYGSLMQTEILTPEDAHIEEIKIRGYTLVPGVLNKEEIALAKEKAYEIYSKQVAEFSSEKVFEPIHEMDTARALLAYDEFFLKVAIKERIVNIIEKMLGQKPMLHSQNAIINKSDQMHRHASWHRDLPHQNFVISKPIAITALFAVDEFSSKTGGTMMLPGTHKLVDLPSEAYIQKYQLQMTAQPGDVLLFDSMIMHRTGDNTAKHDRIAINHVYTVPLIKQQIDLPALLGEKYNTPALRGILGYSTEVPESVAAWRQAKIDKLSLSPA